MSQPDWVNEVIKLRNSGVSRDKTGQLVKKKYPEEFEGVSETQVIRKCRYVYDLATKGALVARGSRRATKEVSREELLSKLRQRIPLESISRAFGTTNAESAKLVDDARADGYSISETSEGYKLDRLLPPGENRSKDDWKGEKAVRFGVVSDTHINCKFTQITFLHQMYDRFHREGITTVYHAGDIDEGEMMRPGHQYECYTQGADDHVKEIARVYPVREGVNTRFITGNHDYAFVRHVGLDIGPQIAACRPDMEYLGASSAVIDLTDNCTLELRHPGDGSAYSISYKTQKMIDAMSGGEKPNILVIGHYHKCEYLSYRNIHAIQAGTTCAQTPWMKSKQIAAHVGAWIVEAFVHDDGSINELRTIFFPQFKAVKNDYLNWR